MFYKSPNQYIREGTAFVIDGVQYPANWLNLSSPADKAAIGLEEVVATNSPANDKFYWVSDSLNGASLTYTNTPKEFAPCQQNLVNQTNTNAYAILLPTDWMVVKAIETGGTVPAAWNTWRQTIRTQAQDYVALVNACTTVDQLAALPQVQWAHDPDYVPPTEGAVNDPV